VGYVRRKGEKPIGFRYEYLVESSDEGLSQFGTSFRLELEGKRWKTFDRGMNIFRDTAGKTTKFGLYYWIHGRGPLSLTAKPTEGGKFRIKREMKGYTDTLELTPKASVNSELWLAPKMQLLAAGKAKSLRYAFPALDSDGDPTLFYSILKAHKPGIVLEQAQVHAKLGKDSTDPAAELHVDEFGVVTKQVNADTITELVYRVGQLPANKVR